MNTAIGKNLERAGYRTYEDGKYITVGMKDKSSSIVTLRLELSDATKYYFHPLANGVYKQDGAFMVSLNEYIMQLKRTNS